MVAKFVDANEVGSCCSSRDLGEGVREGGVCQSPVTPLFWAPWAKQMSHPGLTVITPPNIPKWGALLWLPGESGQWG